MMIEALKEDIEEENNVWNPNLICTLLSQFIDLRIVLVKRKREEKATVFTPSGQIAEVFVDLEIIAQSKLAEDKKTVYLLQCSYEEKHYNLVLFNG